MIYSCFAKCHQDFFLIDDSAMRNMSKSLRKLPCFIQLGHHVVQAGDTLWTIAQMFVVFIYRSHLK
ncbi:LysM peptidoglycan-binding domain-containing protein [Parageobacillus sp. VR-IP]|nr:LysM peptidoglycan-binding domain-containing protein [Parageobacillus sp. VR-IP]